MKTIITESVEETYECARVFAKENVRGGRILCLQGDLGGGKTTFAQGVLQTCGAQGPYTSPTFTIMKEYIISTQEVNKIYHIDAYRIDADDMVELGWYDIISDEKVFVIVEWPEKIQNIIPDRAMYIFCDWISSSKHKYTSDNL